jgi:hypothetical protein
MRVYFSEQRNMSATFAFFLTIVKEISRHSAGETSNPAEI